MSQTDGKYQVLVVDDSPVYRKLVEQLLTMESYSLLFANNFYWAAAPAQRTITAGRRSIMAFGIVRAAS